MSTFRCLLRLLYRDLRVQLLSGRPLVLTNFLYPLVYIFVVGFAFQGLIPQVELGGQRISYTLFLVPGIVAVQVMFTASWFASQLWVDRRLGMFEQLLVMPFSRQTYFLSKLLVSMIQGLVNAFLVLLIASPILFSLKITGIGLVYATVSLLLGALFFGSLGLALSTLTKSQEIFISVMNLILFPAVFLSGVFYPLTNVPPVLRVAMLVNPLTYVGDIMRIGLFDIDISATLLFLKIAMLAVESFSMLTIAILAFHRVKV